MSPAAAESLRPLADRMRPRTLEEFVGQRHLLSEGKPLYAAIKSAQLHSLILWGPPGTGKTTLARLIAQTANAEFIALSAVMAGVKDIRAAVETARASRAAGRPTLLFLDEVHRFNKAQQDTFLPFVEDGTLTFVGATTENPSFEVIGALLSRARVYVLKALAAEDLRAVLEHALGDEERGLGAEHIVAEPEALDIIAQAADGDARRALNMLELAVGLAQAAGAPGRLGAEQAREVTSGGFRRFDKGGDQFYEQISALHKAVRGSDPDASLYWLCRMLAGGCDPRYIARRVVRMASEDLGLADPRAGSDARCLGGIRAAGQSRRRAGARQRGRLSRLRAEEQCGVRGDGRGHGGRRRIRHAGSATEAAQRADPSHEGARLRSRLPLRAR